MNKSVLRWALLLGALGGMALMAPSVSRKIAATRLLLRMKDEDRSVAPMPGKPVSGLVDVSGEKIRAYLYGPSRDAARISIVLGHGIHHRGIDEPRLIRFARHLASLGCRVLTPELSDLTDYRVSLKGADTLTRSVAYLAAGGDQVGLIGFSFAGGMAILAGGRPDTRAHLKYVASVGGYHDLSRTLRFLATDRVETPVGFEERRAHEYGLLVLLYGHLSELDLGADEQSLKSALFEWLKENRKAAREHAKSFSTEKAQRIFHLLEQRRLREMAPEILVLLDRHREELLTLSPKNTALDPNLPVVLIHGASDDVVPPEETLFFAKQRKEQGGEVHALVTPLLEHVRVDHPAGVLEKWQLVSVMSEIF